MQFFALDFAFIVSALFTPIIELYDYKDLVALRKSQKMPLFIVALLTSTLIASTQTAPSPVYNPRRGQCSALAFNYIISVSTIKECLWHCDCSDQCNYYSYCQGEGPQHLECYLYQECSSIRHDNDGSQWNYGSRSSLSTCSSSPLIPQKVFFKLGQTFNIFF